jgi:hypothetical protein
MLFLIPLVSLATICYAGDCFIQDIYGNCIQRTSRLTYVQQPQVPISESNSPQYYSQHTDVQVAQKNSTTNPIPPGVRLFLWLIFIALGVWGSIMLARYCDFKYNYNPYNGLNFIILMACTIGPIIFGLSLMTYGIGAGMDKNFWLCCFIAGTGFVLIRNTIKTNFLIALISVITMLPAAILAALALVGIISDLNKRLGGGRR